jgi:HD-GYP domain-containing protein (c-di-GMP phosphodiesterase class II)
LFLLSALLEELLLSLKAEAIALVKHYPLKCEVSIELARGDWSSWTGSRLGLDRDMVNLVSLTGEMSQKSSKLARLQASSPELWDNIRHFYHTPLLYRGRQMGAIWFGHRTPMVEEGFPLLHLIGDVAAQALFYNRVERDKAVPMDGNPPASVQSLLRRIASWDNLTFDHSLNLVPWAKATARTLGCSDEEVRSICWATLLHDLGKICIPRAVLNKQGPLSPDEWRIMKLHPGIGGRLVPLHDNLKNLRDLIKSHHEKFNGTGYPCGLAGDMIPMGARILAVVDAYGAMTGERVYRKPVTHAEAVEEIQRCSGTHFDPRVVQAFLAQF